MGYDQYYQGPPESSSARGRNRVSSTDYLANMARQLSAVSANLSVIQQKLAYVGRNERVLNKNMIMLNSKVKDLEAKIAGVRPGQAVEAAPGKTGSVSKTELASLSEEIAGLNSVVADLQKRLGLQQKEGASEEIAKIRHLLKVVDPSKFATLDDVERIVEERLKKSKK